MTVNKSPKISRRDAIKILAAAGAVTIAGLPDKWSKPVVQFGALPVHAQTSRTTPLLHTLLCAANPPDFGIFQNDPTATFQVTISPATLGISMHYSINLGSDSTLVTPASVTGNVLTNASGIAMLSTDFNPINVPGSATVTWGFTNPADGSGSCTQTFNWVGTN